jgi:hypothetical protein
VERKNEREEEFPPGKSSEAPKIVVDAPKARLKK